MFDDLDPKEFEDTARVVVEACAAAETTKARATLLAEAGLIGVSAPEDAGGLGLPLNFAVPVAAAAGAGLLGFALIEAMVLSKALSAVDPDLAGKVMAGETVVTVAWTGVAEDGAVNGAPLVADADHVLIFRQDGSAVLAPVGGAVSVETTQALDVDAPEALVRLSGAVEGVELTAQQVADIQADATILRTAFVRGSSETCLSMAAEYAQERVQFGRPLSAYQVIRHRLSRDALAVETMRNSLARAVADVDGDAVMARNAAWLGTVKAGITVAESAIQVFGGMGFTWDVPLHRHLRQMRAQAAYGAASDGLEMLGEQMLTTRNNEWYAEIENVL